MFAKILQDELSKSDFYIVISDKPGEQTYKINFRKNNVWFGNTQLVNYIKSSTGFSDNKVKFRVSTIPDNEVTWTHDKNVYPIITKVNLFKTKPKKRAIK